MKATVISIVAAAALIGGAFALTPEPSSVDPLPENNVSIENGIQVVEIRAKGGYQPRKSVAKAGIPTIIRFNTNGTFDCSSSVSIPSLNIGKILPRSGSTDIDIGTGKIGTLRGSCGMGMYPFEIEFQV